MPVRSYQDLVVWQKAMDSVMEVYKASGAFPKAEQFGLTNQVRRAAVSIPSNIAEGQGRQTTRDFLNFLSMSRGSLQEVETQVLIGERLGYINENNRQEIVKQIAEVGRLLSGLSSSLSRKL
jgi:four helix bundle protein